MKLFFVIPGIAVLLVSSMAYQRLEEVRNGTSAAQKSAHVSGPSASAKYPIRTLHQFDELINVDMTASQVRKLMGPPESTTTRFELGPPASITSRFNLFHKRVAWTYHVEGHEVLLNFCDGKLGSCGY